MVKKKAKEKQWVKLLVYGFLLWLVPFLVSVAMNSLHKSQPFFFQSIMAVVLSLAGMFFIVVYLSSVKKNFFHESVMLGIFWLLLNIIFDIVILVPMKNMNLVQYITDIGLRYITIPIMSTGFGYYLERHHCK